MARSWEHASIDSSAGVRLMPRIIYCPRCGVAKGTSAQSPRAGLCRDCRDTMPREDLIEWRKAS